MKLSLHKKSILALLAFVSFAFVQELGAQCSPPNATAGTANCPGNITLTASGSTGLFRWYNQPTGGTVIATTSSYTTPNLYETTTFYVEAVDNLLAPTCSSGRVAVLALVNPLTSPTVTGGGTINCGSSATLTASGSTGLFRWYDSPSGGTPIGFGTTYNTGNITNLGDTFYVEASQLLNPTGQSTFNFTGNVQTWTVPTGVTSILVDLRGAQGGRGYDISSAYSEGGLGGRVTAVMPVTAGQTLNIYVGGTGANGVNTVTTNGGYNGGGSGYFYGGGGGGGTDIRIGGTAVGNRVIVAGGGGGGGYNCGTLNAQRGGAGGGLTGGAGIFCSNPDTYYCGQGGGQTNGGNNAGIIGGAAGIFSGSSACCSSYHVGGGGGYYGGGSSRYGGGGGGSSWANTNATNVSHTQGFQTGNGQVIISYVVPTCNSARVPVVVSATPLSAPTVTTLNIACGSTAPVSLTGGGPLYAFYDSLTAPLPSSIDTILTLPFLTANDTLYIGSVSGNPAPVVQNFSFTGSLQTWTVPAGVSSVTVTLNGAKGGDNSTMGTNNGGGLGGRVTALMQVTPGEVLNIYVGGTTTTWQGGWNGGGNANTSWNFTRGGGGATDIRIGGTALSNRVIVAGGGGGGGYNCTSNNRGGHGGNLTGENGYECNNNTGTCYPGRGGSQTAGGLNGGCCNSPSGHGQLGIGGNGGVCGEYGGGGGGGYFGGGGGYFGGGGGGSSWTNTVRCSNVTHTQGVQNSAGSVSISYQLPVCQSTVVPVIVNVGPLAGPVVSDTTVACGSGVTILAGSTAQQVTWWDAPTGGNMIAQGIGLALPPVTSATTYYVQERNVTGGSQSLTFTNCGKVGNTGPSQADCNAAYGPNVVNVVGGIQEWTVPFSGTFRIEAWGAQGSTATATSGGRGAYIAGDFQLTQGQVVRMLVGQNAPNTPGRENVSSSGGGGTFVTVAPHNTESSILVIAGGGGGTGAEQPATADGTSNNTAQTGSAGTGGSNGTGGSSGISTAGAGGGFFTNGNGGGGAGVSYISGGQGGPTNSTYSINGGGFGGGGSVTAGGCARHAGGGGYSGGSGSSSACTPTTGHWGGGGGSYNNGTNQASQAGVRQGHGQVVISWNTFSECLSPRFPLVVAPDSLPAPSITPDAFGCSPVTHTFTASGGFSNFTWYDGPVSGTANVVATGSSITSTVNDTTEYFVGYTDPNGCPSKLRKGTIFAVPSPVATLVSPVNYCNSDGIVSLQAVTSGGFWSGTGIVNAGTGDFDASSLTPGQYNIAYVVSNIACSDSSNTVITIQQGPNAAITSVPGPFCEFDAAQALTPADPSGTFTGTAVSTAGLFDPILSGPGSHTVYYQIVASNGCIGNDSATLVVNPIPDASVVTPTNAFCSSDFPFQLQAVNQGGTWSGLGVTPSGQAAPQLMSLGLNTVIYTLVQNGCVGIDSASVQVDPGANPQIVSSPLTICNDGQPVLFNAAVPGGQWSGNGIADPTSGLFTPSLAQSGTSYVRYTIQQGICTGVDSIAVTVNPVPTASLSATNTGICQGTSTTLNASGGVSYKWFLNGFELPGVTGASYTTTSPGTYTVKAVSASNCVSAASSSIPLTVYAKPSIAGFGAQSICEGSPSMFNQQSAVSGANGAVISNYAWDFGIPGGVATGSSPSFTYPNAGGYNVTLMVTTNQGCSDTLVQQVYVNPSPVVASIAAADVCQGNAVTFLANTSIVPLNGATIQQESWNFGNGFVANGSTAQHNYPSVGLQHYTYNALSNQGCSTVVNGTVTVHQNPTAVFNAQGACQGSGIVFNNLSSGNIASYQWNFGDGNVSNLAAPTHTYLNAGTYLPTLQIATAFGCQSSYSQVINITPGPVSTFTNTQMGGLTRLFTPSNIIAGAQYLWNFGDGTLSNDVTPIKTFNTAATYQVCLNLASQGCETYYCENITIKNLVGIDGQELSSGLMVYPNPFSDLIQVELNLMENSPVSFGFYDLAGRLMFTRNFTAGGAGARQFSLPMNSSELPNGVYVLSIEAGAQKWIERVVKMND